MCSRSGSARIAVERCAAGRKHGRHAAGNMDHQQGHGWMAFVAQLAFWQRNPSAPRLRYNYNLHEGLAGFKIVSQ